MNKFEKMKDTYKEIFMTRDVITHITLTKIDTDRLHQEIRTCYDQAGGDLLSYVKRGPLGQDNFLKAISEDFYKALDKEADCYTDSVMRRIYNALSEETWRYLNDVMKMILKEAEK